MKLFLQKQLAQLRLKLGSVLDKMSTRDKRLLMVSGIVVAVFVFYSYLWVPVADELEKNKSRYLASKEDLAWIARNLDTAKNLAQRARAVKSATEPLNILIPKVAKQNTVPILQIDVRNLQAYIKFDRVLFKNLVGFLFVLNNTYAITVTRLDIEVLSPGEIRGFIVLTRQKK